MKSLISLSVSLLILGSSAFSEDRNGTMSINDWSNPEGTVKIPLMKVRYTFKVFFGEPTQTFFFYYEPIDDFTRISTIKLQAQVVAGGNLTDAYITFDPLVDQPNKWGWDVAGSPDWEKMFHSDAGGAIGKDRAKQFFRDGISLTNLQVVEIAAQSGIDDADYDEFARQIPTSYTSGDGNVGLLDRSLPKTNFGSSEFGDGAAPSSWNSSSMWAKRVTGADYLNQYARVTEENTRSISLKSTQHTTWKYSKYQHAAIEIVLADAVFAKQDKDIKKKDKQKVSIEIIWEDWEGGSRRQVQKHTFNKTLIPKERMTAVDRILRRERKDGTLATYHVQYVIRFHDMEEEEEAEDPLEGLEEKKSYKDKLNATRILTKQAKEERQEYEEAMRVAVQKANDEADEHERLQQIKQAEWDEKERLRRLEQDEKNREKQEAEMEQQAASDAQAQQEAETEQQAASDALELKRIEEESYEEFYVLVEETRLEERKPPKGTRGLVGRVAVTDSYSKIFTVKYTKYVEAYPGISLAGRLHPNELKIFQGWHDKFKYQYRRNVYIFYDKEDAVEGKKGTTKEFYLDPPPDKLY